jgi:hypothetical protein
VIAPTGKYNPEKDINQGANFTSINPYSELGARPRP